jgi:hypothetical protein
MVNLTAYSGTISVGVSNPENVSTYKIVNTLEKQQPPFSTRRCRR